MGSPGTLATFFGNEYYKGENGYEDFVGALGKAMAVEYKTIQEAGLILQLDCPDLGMGRHTRHMDKTTEEFQKVAKWHVKVLNEHEVWGKDNVNVPANKTFLPGVIDA